MASMLPIGLRRVAKALTLCLGLSLSGAVASAQPAGAPHGAHQSGEQVLQGDARRGESIYDTGRRLDGSPVVAVRASMGAVPPEVAACVNCHRPSGLGQREGRILVPAVAGHLLFAPLKRATTARLHPGLQQQALRAYDREAYDQPSLAQAVRAGLDPANRALSPVMPRYALDERDLADLEAHLRAQSARPLTGVQNGTLYIASVVTPQASDAARRAVNTAMSAWAEKLSLGGWSVRWRLWELTGPASTWSHQLNHLWSEQGVFALVSGAGGTDWAPVAQFCDAHRVPCVFPSLEAVPAQASSGRFSFYLSGGLAAEAAMLARAATSPASSPIPATPVVHLFKNDDPAGPLAAQALEHPMRAQSGAGTDQKQTRHLSGTLDELRAGLAGIYPGETTALWLRDADLNDLMQSTPPPPGDGAVWVSASLAPPHRVTVPPAWRSRLVWASLHADTVRRNAGGALSARPWARSLDLPDDLDVVVLNDVHAATFYFTDTLARMREGLNAEYFTERLEDAVGLGPAGAGYFRLSLGPNQRIAAQSGHLLGFKEGSASPVKISPLMRAEIPAKN